MFKSEDLSKIFEFIQKLVPHVELLRVNFEEITAIKELNIELGNTKKIYNEINFNIGVISSQQEPVAIDTPIKSLLKIEKNSAFYPKNTSAPRNTLTKDIESIPFTFGAGFHLIINNRNWWNKERDNDKSGSIRRYIKLIPICKRNWSYVKTIEKENRFGFQINESGEVYVKIWADELNGVRIKELPSRFLKLFRFEEYYPGNIIKFENFPEIVISLDKTVVEKAILVKYDPEESPSEYFVFILAQD